METIMNLSITWRFDLSVRPDITPRFLERTTTCLDFMLTAISYEVTLFQMLIFLPTKVQLAFLSLFLSFNKSEVSWSKIKKTFLQDYTDYYNLAVRAISEWIGKLVYRKKLWTLIKQDQYHSTPETLLDQFLKKQLVSQITHSHKGQLKI